MAIEITGETYDAWVKALESLVEENDQKLTVNFPDGIKFMSAQAVLGYLQGSSSGVHLTYTDDLWDDLTPKTRMDAGGQFVRLGDDASDDYITQVIRNAEQLTGIEAAYPPPKDAREQ